MPTQKLEYWAFLDGQVAEGCAHVPLTSVKVVPVR